MARRPIQLDLRPRTWGGKRPGAGRKPSGRKVGVPHQCRALHHARHPLHVTLRARQGLPSLRTDAAFPALQKGLAQASRSGLRILQFSIQNDHVHLIVEAVDRHALSRGLQGLAIRIAKRLNRVLGRRGRVWADRYHARALRTPREMRNALVYVCSRGVDGRSSGIYFDGWRVPIRTVTTCRPVVLPRTWLAAVGWRRLGLLHPDESPAPPRRRQ